MRTTIFALLTMALSASCGVGPAGPTGPKGDKGDPGDPYKAPKNCMVIQDTDLGFVTADDWKPANWYDTAKKPAEEVMFDAYGIVFPSPTSNSHTTVMKDVGDVEVGYCEHLYLRFKGQVYSQTLPGSGMDDREAPLGLTVKYTDEAGTLHASLNAYNEGEPDDQHTTRMFWKGFTIDDSAYMNANAVKVEPYHAFVKVFDLMELNPKPAKIHWVAISSAGWGPARSGIAMGIGLNDGKCCCE